MKPIGNKTWLIGDGFMASHINDYNISHESVCVLNVSDEDCDIVLTFYFEDRDPMRGFTSKCAANRTHHVRLDKLRDADGNPVPKDVPYAILVECSIPVVIQHTRLDTTPANQSLMTTMAYAID